MLPKDFHVDVCHAGAAFDFAAYMRQSMEEDYAHLVGLGLGMWLFLIAFVLLSTVLGVSAMLKPEASEYPKAILTLCLPKA